MSDNQLDEYLSKIDNNILLNDIDYNNLEEADLELDNNYFRKEINNGRF